MNQFVKSHELKLKMIFFFKKKIEIKTIYKYKALVKTTNMDTNIITFINSKREKIFEKTDKICYENDHYAYYNNDNNLGYFVRIENNRKINIICKCDPNFNNDLIENIHIENISNNDGILNMIEVLRSENVSDFITMQYLFLYCLEIFYENENKKLKYYKFNEFIICIGEHFDNANEDFKKCLEWAWKEILINEQIISRLVVQPDSVVH